MSHFDSEFLEMPHMASTTSRSPSLCSVASSTVQSAKLVAKSIQKVVKKGTSAAVHPFKKARSSASSTMASASVEGMFGFSNALKSLTQ